jgi:hypothetical protein
MKYGMVVHTITGESYIGKTTELSDTEKDEAINFSKKVDKIIQISLECVNGSFMSFRGEHIVALEVYNEKE